MAKELPYWQFEPAQYLTGTIQFCSLEAQGLFINIASIYWQRECDLSVEQVNRKHNKPELLEQLIKENILKVKNGKITIDFLLSQYTEISSKKKVNSENGSEGAKIRWGGHKKANGEKIAPPSKSDGIKIREEEIRRVIHPIQYFLWTVLNTTRKS